MNSDSYGSGAQPPGILPASKFCRLTELPELESMATWPPPLMLVASPLVASQLRRATSWVLPSCGDERVLPARSAGKFPSAIDLLTTSPAPPDAVPATMTTLPLVLM